jgi:protein-disulfide isomerase
VFLASAGSGIAVAMLGVGRAVPSLAQLPQSANLVLVVQTATPVADAPGGAFAGPAAAQPTAEVLPDVSVTETLAGARDGLRLGRADAPVQIVIFADPQCPYCRQLALGAERQLIDEYVTPGKAALTYRHYPFLGAESTRGAQAMECAGRQGADAFWQFNRQVFDNQFPENSGQLTDAKLLEWAGATGLDVAKLKDCLAGADVKAVVEADLALGQRLGVQGTPVVFVNGRRVVGAVPYDMLKAIVDAALAGVRP